MSLGCSPTVLAYGHYPLQVIAQAETRSAAAHPAGKGSRGWRSVKEVLLSHGVAAYVSGHLHSVFGRCLHRLVPNSFGGMQILLFGLAPALVWGWEIHALSDEKAIFIFIF